MIIKPRLKPNMAPKWNEEDNVPATNFQRLDSGSEPGGQKLLTARGTEMAKKAEKEKKTESN